jgi:hypothetical protein
MISQRVLFIRRRVNIASARRVSRSGHFFQSHHFSLFRDDDRRQQPTRVTTLSLSRDYLYELVLIVSSTDYCLSRVHVHQACRFSVLLMKERKLQASKTRKSLFVSFLAICSVLFYVSPAAAAFDEVSKPHILRRGGAVNTVEPDRPKSSIEDEIMETAEDLAIVFSDIDGTLVHYPTTDDQEKGVQEESSNDNRILELPPSSTGMKGIISCKTLRQCRDIRRQGVKLVLVSGMRSSTLLKRLPYLPRADAYCCEAGGRIFYPSIHPVQQNEDTAGLTVTPESYDGAQAQDLEAFGLVEDMDWRREMERIDAAGKDGFISNELGDDNNQAPMSIAGREGPLWEFARRLLADGYVLDTKGYASCFRVNRNQQSQGRSTEVFDALIDGNIACPSELSTSTNLGCVDFYPVASGKKNWYVSYLSYCIE